MTPDEWQQRLVQTPLLKRIVEVLCVKNAEGVSAQEIYDGAGLGWQPIETAPRDGTAILAKLPDSDCPVVIRSGLVAWLVSWDNYQLSKNNQPTHWMPLP